jgi:hypothetical protein
VPKLARIEQAGDPNAPLKHEHTVKWEE